MSASASAQAETTSGANPNPNPKPCANIPIIVCNGDERSTLCSEAEGVRTNDPPAAPPPAPSALSLNVSPMICDRTDPTNDAELGLTRPPCLLGGPAGGRT